ncbi:MAG: cellulase family glycosylhydrolase [Eubacteriales bacterium]|nr:cellulase family glycosylhydrolase [Eubacteriales bacterium]
MSRTAKKMLTIILSLQLVLSTLTFSLPVNATVNRSRELKVNGNKIVLAENENVVVRLTGMNIPGGEWTGTPGVERLKRSAKEAMENWDTNIIRLPVSVEGWFGTYSYVNDDGLSYQNYMDEVIEMVSEAGKYVVLDLHHYNSFNNELYLDFWTEAATKYQNNPTVLFGLLNEPTINSWSSWRDGNGSNITGHQQVVEMIRDLGAKNILIAGGLSWGYDLRGIVGEASGDSTIYALVDQGSNDDLTKAGNGIMYDTHIYPWKGRTANWHANVGSARMQYPLLIGENGWDPGTNSSVGGAVYNPGDPMYHDQWVPELFAWMNDGETYGNLANWTGWCFHPTSSPRILDDPANWGNDATYDYPPTSYWGVYVKQQLKTDLGDNLSINQLVSGSESDEGNPIDNAVDDDPDTLWSSSVAGDKYITVDLGQELEADRWIVRHAGTRDPYTESDNTVDFQLQVSNDESVWTDVDTVTGNTNNVTDRFIEPVTARYFRLYVTQAADIDDVLRIYDFSVYRVGANLEIPSTAHTITFTDEDNNIVATRVVLDGRALTDIPAVPAKTGFRGFWSILTYTNITQDMTITATYEPEYVPLQPTDKILERTMKDGQQPNIWGVWNGLSLSYAEGKSETGVHDALYMTGGASGGGGQIALDAAGFNDFTGFDTICLRVKSNKSFSIRFKLENRADTSVPSKSSKAVTIASTNGEWADRYVSVQDLKPDTNGDWINSMKTQYTSDFQPIVLMRIENANFGTGYEATIGNMKAIWYTPDPSTLRTITFVDENATTVATRVVVAGETLTDIPAVPAKEGYDGSWDAASFSNITEDMLVTAIYDWIFVPLNVIEKSLERTMKVGQQPGVWGTWGGTSMSYVNGKSENGANTALYITGGSNGGGGQLALDAATFNDFTGFDTFYFRVKSTADFGISMRLEYRADDPDTIKQSKVVTIPSTNGVWADRYVSAADLMPDVDGDWINSMKGLYTTDFQPIVLMRFENVNFESTYEASIGNIKALWYKKDCTITFVAEDGTTVLATRQVNIGETLTDIPTIPTKQGYYPGVWSVSDFTNITTDMTVKAGYEKIFEPILPLVSSLERTMKSGQQPGVWGTWSGTSLSYVNGKSENGAEAALYITGGSSGGGGQIALDSGAFSNFIGFDTFCLRVKSTANFAIRMRLEYRADDPDTIKQSKLVTIPSTNGVWADRYVSAADLMPDVDGDWINSMKGAYTTDFQPVILMRFENVNFGTTKEATIGNMKALWYEPGAVAYRTVTFVAEDGVTVLDTKTVEYGTALTDIPTVPNKQGYTGNWSVSDFTNITENMTVRVGYEKIFHPVYPLERYLEQTMKSGQQPAVWGTWNGASMTYTSGKGENGIDPALYITGGAAGGGGQLAFISGTFGDFRGFDGFYLRVKSNASFGIRMKLEYRADDPDTIQQSKIVTIPSTNGVWADIYISPDDLKPDVDGDWIYNMKYGYTTNFQPVILMRFENINFGTTKEATVGNIKALWHVEDPSVIRTVTFVDENATLVDTRLVLAGATLTDIPNVPAKAGYTGTWNVTDFTNITSDMTVTPVYTIAQTTTHTITFVDEDGVTVIATREVEDGAALTDIPTVPAKAGYTGAWDVTDFASITTSMTVTAEYTPIMHTITFVDEDNVTVIATREVQEGTDLLDIPTVPDKFGYTGVWNITEFTDITADMTVIAVYTLLPPSQRLSIGTITMSDLVDGKLTFTVPYTAIDIDQVTILAVLGGGDTPPTTIEDSDIVYMDRQAPLGISSFTFKVRLDKLTEIKNKIFISIGGADVDSPKPGVPQEY